MTPGRVTVLAPLLVLALAAITCDEPDHETWIGEHLRYTWNTELEPCAGTFTYLDGFVPFVADQLQLDVDDLGALTYQWFTPGERRVLAPLWGRGGVTLGRHVLISAPLARHEVVHQVETARYTYVGPRFLTEGLAVAFEERGPGSRFNRTDPRPFLPRGYLGGYDFYEPAGPFVAYLLSLYGPEPFFELYRGLPLGARVDHYRRAFADIYGRDLDDEVERYLSAESCPEGASAVPMAYECAAPTIPWGDDGRWSYARSIACEDSDVAGEPEAMVTGVTVEIPADGDYDIDVAGDLEVEITLVSCGPCPWLARDPQLFRNRRFDLKASLYGIRFRAGDFALTAISIRRIDHDDSDDDGADDDPSGGAPDDDHGAGPPPRIHE